MIRANPTGNPTEQVRARHGWIDAWALKDRRAMGLYYGPADMDGATCRSCTHVEHRGSRPWCVRPTVEFASMRGAWCPSHVPQPQPETTP